MAWNYRCDYCGAHLDAGERCDCHEENRQTCQEQDAAAQEKNTQKEPTPQVINYKMAI